MEVANDNELPRSRAEAKKLGSIRYFTGKPCKHGHMSTRVTSSGQCKECSRILGREAYAKDSTKAKAYQVEFRAQNRELSRSTSKKWREENPERNTANINRWKEENPDYREKNIDHLRLKAREYSAKRRSTPRGKIDDAISAGMRDTLGRGQKRGTRWEELVGYTVDQLMRHLEAKFTDGMTWENYGRGGWHIDHETPKSAFNYETPFDIDFQRAWALSNLQPLWERDNIQKGAKLTKPFQPSLALAV